MEQAELAGGWPHGILEDCMDTRVTLGPPPRGDWELDNDPVHELWDDGYILDTQGNVWLTCLLNRLYEHKHGGIDVVVEDMLDEETDEGEDGEILPPPPDYMHAIMPSDVPTGGPHLYVDPQATINYSKTDNDVPRADVLNNSYVRVVHVNGIHHIGLIFCSTCHSQEHTHCDLMAQCLLLTSFTRYKTVFTHAVLDDFQLENLECKTSAYQYFQKLCRHTSPMYPDSVLNLYHELHRMSCIWRWMKKLKWARYGHRPDDPASDLQPGELANFCPACPQLGVNLPDDWTDDPKR